MRLVSTKSVKPGSKLAQPVYNDKGSVLIQRDVELTVNIIDRLRELRYTYVYIRDDRLQDIELYFSTSNEKRLKAMQVIHKSFQEIKKNDNGRYLTEKMTDKITSSIQEMVSNLRPKRQTLTILSDMLIYDDYIFSHSVNVALYAMAIANEMKLPVSVVEEIGFGAILHDVGKMFVPQEVLQKTGKLTDSEFKQIKEHTTKGFHYLRKMNNIPLVVAHCAYQHHERMNGSGYPRGISGSDIHLYAKIIGIADVFDAVTSNRVYRDAMLPHEGLEILFAGAGDQFDMEMVEAFKRSVAIYPTGLTVRLSDGRMGIVIRQNEDINTRPIIRILQESDGTEPAPYEVDLYEHLNITVVACSTSAETN
ncbi:HD-GYP domain-containing protein [Terribacillus saccharophilus]|uniref:HDIG domain-containing protein n=1 Tax=Terribacillus saccharophilus TaxID=361277 RepID=A0A075LUV8_9BACI|nr:MULTISPECIES: HD-GYP domain-containing protein [Terribacillus]AIF68213.1 histidine kinase [Terribacillus goriensis]MCM3226340.1 HD-GYP domain-containing protein [Terribacillus saccharophilus]SEN16695.1 HDIG domain-containing protein [Terribacillus saccharophilus]